MHLTLHGATFVRARREAVWAALHDADVIARCLPGCQSLARTGESLFALTSRIAVGPLRLVMNGTVEWAESDPPHSCCLVGRGSGGRSGASGRVRIVLADAAGGCRMRYAIEADASGYIAGAGAIVVSGIGRGLTHHFAARFGALVERGGL